MIFIVYLLLFYLSWQNSISVFIFPILGEFLGIKWFFFHIFF